MFCCSSLVGQNFSILEKKKKNWSRDWINTHANEASSQIARLWLSVEIVSGCTVPFGSRIINCSQEETLGNLLWRLEEDNSRRVTFLFFLPATQVYFVIKLAGATKHQAGLALQWINTPWYWRPGLTVLAFPGVLALHLPLPLPLPLPCCLSELPMKLFPLDSRGSTLPGVIAKEIKGWWTVECNALTLQFCMLLWKYRGGNACKLACHPLLDLPYVSFIFSQRSLIEGCLASTDKNMSNIPGSTLICDSTAISRFEVLAPLSCIMLLANSTTAEVITLSENSSHARLLPL